MAILWVLIPISFILMACAIWAFFWAVDNDQMDNLDSASIEALDLPAEQSDGDAHNPAQDTQPTK